jgi:hypothetical protein
MMQTSKQEASSQTDSSLMESYFKVKELENRKEKETDESLMEQNGNLSKRNGQKSIRRVR